MSFIKLQNMETEQNKLRQKDDRQRVNNVFNTLNPQLKKDLDHCFFNNSVNINDVKQKVLDTGSIEHFSLDCKAYNSIRTLYGSLEPYNLMSNSAKNEYTNQSNNVFKDIEEAFEKNCKKSDFEGCSMYPTFSNKEGIINISIIKYGPIDYF